MKKICDVWLLVIITIVTLNACIRSKEKKVKSQSQLFSNEALQMPQHNTAQHQNTKGFIYTVVEQMPEFPGGEEALTKYLKDNLKYPKSAIKDKIEGVVMVQFIINEYGRIGNKINIVRSLNKACDKETERVIRMFPPWIPGKQYGENVSVLYTLPIRFKLNK